MQTHTRVTRFESRHRAEKVKKAFVWALVFDGILGVFIQPFRPVLVVGDSMFPTLKNLQIVLARKFTGNPERGQVVVCNYDDESLIKRIGGIAGDRGLPGQLPRQSVPVSSVYLLGDNSKVSVDSRMFGAVPTDSIEYSVVFPSLRPR